MLRTQQQVEVGSALEAAGGGLRKPGTAAEAIRASSCWILREAGRMCTECSVGLLPASESRDQARTRGIREQYHVFSDQTCTNDRPADSTAPAHQAASSAWTSIFTKVGEPSTHLRILPHLPLLRDSLLPKYPCLSCGTADARRYWQEPGGGHCQALRK